MRNRDPYNLEMYRRSSKCRETKIPPLRQNIPERLRGVLETPSRGDRHRTNLQLTGLR
jgi:hypothetical protein